MKKILTYFAIAILSCATIFAQETVKITKIDTNFQRICHIFSTISHHNFNMNKCKENMKRDKIIYNNQSQVLEQGNQLFSSFKLNEQSKK